MRSVNSPELRAIRKTLDNTRSKFRRVKYFVPLSERNRLESAIDELCRMREEEKERLKNDQR